MLMYEIENHNSLRILQLSGIDLNDQVMVDYLADMIGSNQVIIEFDLSNVAIHSYYLQ